MPTPKPMRPAASRELPSLMAEPPTGLTTPGRRWRFRRDLVIYLAHTRNGLPQRLLADVFDLPRSRIAEIVKDFARHDPDAGDG